MFPIIPFVDWTEQEKNQEQKNPKNFESKLYFITVAENTMKYYNFFFFIQYPAGRRIHTQLWLFSQF